MSIREFFTSQPWWGKILGAFFGYLIGGPAGAFFGILVGNFFDRGLADHFARPYWTYHAEKREAAQKIFFEATFAVMGHIAKADGRVSKQEIQMAQVLMDEMRLNQEQKALAKRFFNAGKKSDFNLAAILTSLAQTCYQNPELLKLFMDIQYRAAQVDGFADQKLQALNVIFRRLGFAPLHQQYRFYEDFGYGPSQSYQQQTNQQYSHANHKHTGYQHTASNLLAQAYAILEVSQSANKQEVKRAYQRLISRNHPDKLIARGLPEEMIKIATDKTQKIRKAYEQICASKGW